MATCDPPPRTIDEGLDWFLSNDASGSGMCAQHTWHSLGGDRGCPPAWQCANANQVYDKVKKSGRYWSDPHQGDIAIWKYGENGHAARVYDEAGTLIVTTNPSSGPSNGTGIEPIGYPSKWGATTSARIFTDTYNGIVCFTSGIEHGDVYLSKLKYGQQDSDSVRRLQMHLNAHTLVGGEELPVTGNYGDQTDEEVILCQVQHGFGEDDPWESSVGPGQAGHLFTGTGCGCNIIDDRDVTAPPTVPPETETPGVTTDVGIWDWYSGKETDKVLVYPGAWKKIALDAQPASGITGKSKEEHFLYLRIHLPKGRSATRTIHTRFVRSDGDETAYKSPAWDAGASDSIAYENFHPEKGTGLGGHWEIMVEGGTDPIDYTTRYAKTYVTYRS